MSFSDVLHSDTTIIRRMEVDLQRKSGAQSYVTRHTAVYEMLPYQQGATNTPAYDPHVLDKYFETF